ncbi:hypothetical protein BU16DRAFT_556418 [Lophium mytilinum]|uniref:Uncharacterized protein n=1 Tax=Lophium mytilinum TaxID=390894 RepID=A0A6A6R5B1_9PEZI|nr:hypothetical protein BU16DRAFT_556418 [Lophium mytilinum]
MPSFSKLGSDKENNVATKGGVHRTQHPEQSRTALGEDTNTRLPVPKKGTAQTTSAPRRGVAIKKKRTLPDRPCDREVYNDLTEDELWRLCERDEVEIDETKIRTKRQIVECLVNLDNKAMLRDSDLEETKEEVHSPPPPKKSGRELRARSPPTQSAKIEPKTTKRKRDDQDDDSNPVMAKAPRQRKATASRPRVAATSTMTSATPTVAPSITSTIPNSQPYNKMSLKDIKDVVMTTVVEKDHDTKLWHALLAYAYEIMLEEGEVNPLDSREVEVPLSKLIEKILEHCAPRREADGGLTFLRSLMKRYDELVVVEKKSADEQRVGEGREREQKTKFEKAARLQEEAERLRKQQRRKEKTTRKAEQEKKREEQQQREEDDTRKLAKRETKIEAQKRAEVNTDILAKTSSSSSSYVPSAPAPHKLTPLEKELVDLRQPSIYTNKPPPHSDVTRGIIRIQKWEMLWSRPSRISRRGNIRSMEPEYNIPHYLIPPYVRVGHVIRKRVAVQREAKDIFAYRKAKALTDVSTEEWRERGKIYKKGKKALETWKESKIPSHTRAKKNFVHAVRQQLISLKGAEEDMTQDDVLVAASKSVEKKETITDSPKKENASSSEQQKREPGRKIIVEDGGTQAWRRELNRHLREDSEGLRKGGLAASRHSSPSNDSSSNESIDTFTARVNPRTGLLDTSGKAALPKSSVPLDALAAIKPVYRKRARDEDGQDEQRPHTKRSRLDREPAVPKPTSRAAPKTTSRATQQSFAPSASRSKKWGYEEHDQPPRAYGRQGRAQHGPAPKQRRHYDDDNIPSETAPESAKLSPNAMISHMANSQIAHTLQIPPEKLPFFPHGKSSSAALTKPTHPPHRHRNQDARSETQGLVTIQGWFDRSLAVPP